MRWIGRLLVVEVNVWPIVLCVCALWYHAKRLRRLLRPLFRRRALRTTPCTVYPLLVYGGPAAASRADDDGSEAGYATGSLSSNASVPSYVYPSPMATRPYRLWQAPFKLLLCVNTGAKLTAQEVCQLTATATLTAYEYTRRLHHGRSASGLWFWQLLGQAKIATRVPSTADLLALHRRVVDAGILSFVVGRPKGVANGRTAVESEYCVATVGPAPSADVDRLCRHLKLL